MLKSNFVTTVTRLRLVVQNYTRAVIIVFVRRSIIVICNVVVFFIPSSLLLLWLHFYAK